MVDLIGVIRIDRCGERVLALMKGAGAEFLANGIRLTYLVKDLETEAQKR